MWSRMMHNYAFVYINGDIHVSHRLCINIPDSKVHGANLGPIWGRQDPGGPRVGPMNLAIWDVVITFECDGCEETCSPKIVSVYISHLNYTYTKMPFILPTPFQTLSYLYLFPFIQELAGEAWGVISQVYQRKSLRYFESVHCQMYSVNHHAFKNTLDYCRNLPKPNNHTISPDTLIHGICDRNKTKKLNYDKISNHIFSINYEDFLLPSPNDYQIPMMSNFHILLKIYHVFWSY